MKRIFLLAVTLAVCVSPAAADLVSWGDLTIDVEYWAGEGDNQAITVIDFGDVSYAFGYSWDDDDTFTRTGDSTYEQTYTTGSAALSEAMLLALADAGDLEITYTYYATMGMSILSISYNGYTITSDWDTTFAGYWWDGYDAYEDYYGNTYSAENPDGTLTAADLGLSSRTLADGYMDGWSLEYTANGYSPINTPTIPTPEPACLALLGTGAVALLRRRR